MRDWPKLQNDSFTTIRYARRDRDWTPGETVNVVLWPRRPDRMQVGQAWIVAKERRALEPGGGVPALTEAEAIRDGLANLASLRGFLDRNQKSRNGTLLHKLTLKWVSKG